jgi:trk system potassium uptake protein
MYVPKAFAGQSLKSLGLREKMRLNVVALKRSSIDVDDAGNSVKREELSFPTPEETLRESDIVYVLGRNADIDSFRNFG